ncbi:MAG TPA: pilus assembly protein TadG-related protein [Acetobacteraceae bacterium]|nr:pilus assembly protein TadG-related protein [Acetobacteraceae bacterium]
MTTTSRNGWLQRLRDRKGFTTATFGVTSIAFLGMAALGTDAGLWYLSLRNARSAADAAAMAGAAAAAVHSSTAVGSTAAFSVAGSNGFANGTGGATVTVNIPPSSGAYTANAGAVEVIIQQVQTRFLSRVLVGTDPTVTVRAVAAPLNWGDACILALGGSGLQIGGNATVASTGCILASNRPGSDSIRIFGSAAITAESLSALGECDGCGSATLTQPFVQYATSPATNPFVNLNDNFPLASVPPAASQINPGSQNRSVTWSPSIPLGGLAAGSTLTAYRTDVQLNNNETLDLLPGVYIFYNASIRIQGGTLTCSTCSPGTAGVTLIFTGDPNSIGSFRMDGNGTVNLMAGPQANPEYSGILMYRDARASGNGPMATIINGSSTTQLSGGLYFPTTDVTYNGNMTAAMPCTALVAQSIIMSGNSNTTVANSGCATYGLNNLTQTRVVRLVE